MFYRNVLLVIGAYCVLFISTQQSFAQCNNGSYSLSEYVNIATSQTISSSIITEVSGLTYNDVSEEFLVVSDDGSAARRRSNGSWASIYYINWSGNTCDATAFSDTEAITYMGSVGSSHSYAIADERERVVTFVDIDNFQNTLSYPQNSYVELAGLSTCGGNDGIEGLAYDAASNTMYVALENNSQSIYSFTVPSTIIGQTVDVNEVVNLRNINGLNTYSTHGMDILPNGNIIALVTKPGSGDNGLFDRMIVEITPCGALIEQHDLEPTITNSAELEGVVAAGGDIYVTGEYGILYQLRRQDVSYDLSLTNPGSGDSFTAGSSVPISWTSNNIAGNIRIELIRVTSTVQTLINSTPNDGIQTVNIPAYLATANDYAIRISSVNDPSISDLGQNFTITAPYIAVSDPTSGTSFSSNTDATVSWASNISGNVRIDLYRNQALVQNLVGSTPGDGSQSVSLPSVATSFTNYQIKVTNVSDPSITDYSDEFAITAVPQISNVAIYGSGFYIAGNQLTVNWIDNIPENVIITLLKNNLAVATLESSTPSDQSQTITLPSNLTTSSNYKINIRSVNDSNLFKNSISFTINEQVVANGSPDLIVTSSGTASITGTTYNIYGITLNNQGDEAATSFNAAVYVSTDQTINFNDHRVGVIASYASLPVNGSVTGNYSFDYAALGLAAGTYYVGIYVDADESQTESIENNNSASISSAVIVISNGGQSGNCVGIAGNIMRENFENGIGNCEQSSSDNMDWSVTNRRTPSNYTGPSAANEGNSYLYVEASRNYNRTAIITSPCLDLSNVNNPKMSFNYHMYGSSMGSLTISVITSSNQVIPIYSKNGNQGDQWHTANLDLSNYSNDQVKIEIKGRVGSSYRSDIAIDNITIEDAQGCPQIGTPCDDGNVCTAGESYDAACNCAGGQYIDDDNDGFCIGEDADDNDACVPVANGSCNSCTQVLSAPYTEGFDSGLGDWTQLNSDNTDWTRISGKTPSNSTGPSEASAGSHYIFVESSGRTRGYPYRVASLMSPCIDLSSVSTPTLSFKYHMLGSTMGKLKVYVQDTESGVVSLIFTQRGNLGNQWHSSVTNLAGFANKTVRFIIEGTTGYSYRSDMAVDAFSVTELSQALQLTETRSVDVTADDFEIEESIGDLTAYPNPAIDYVTVKFESSVDDRASLTLTNHVGQIVAQQSIILKEGEVQKTIQVSDYKPGIYHLTISHNDTQMTTKLLVINN